MTYLFYKLKDKPGDGEQKEEVEIDVTEVMSQTEDSHRSTSPEDQEPKQPQENIDPSAETQHVVYQATSTKSNIEPEEKTQSALASPQKTVSVKKEDSSTVQVVPECCDDPCDTDYMPSKNISVSAPVFNVQVMSNCFQFIVNVKDFVFACRNTVEITYKLIIHELQREKNQKARSSKLSTW